MRTEGEHSRLPALGKRGEGWVLGQVVLMAAVAVSALAGRGWGDGRALAAHLVGGTLLAAGIALLGAGARGLGRSLTPLPAPRQEHALVTTGVYGLVRHPMYGGGILVALGWSVFFATVAGLALTAVLAVFLDLKARREELWLCARVAGYDAYRRRTRRKFLPYVY